MQLRCHHPQQRRRRPVLRSDDLKCPSAKRVKYASDQSFCTANCWSSVCLPTLHGSLKQLSVKGLSAEAGTCDRRLRRPCNSLSLKWRCQITRCRNSCGATNGVCVSFWWRCFDYELNTTSRGAYSCGRLQIFTPSIRSVFVCTVLCTGNVMEIFFVNKYG